MEISPKLSKVTVFQDRAQLYKDVVVSLAPGDHTLICTGVWSSVDRDTLQVGAGKGRENCLLRSVQFTTVRSVTDVRPERAALDEELKRLNQQASAVRDRITLAQESIEAYEAVLKKVSSTSSEEFSDDHGDPDKWFAIMEFATTGIQTHTEKKRSSEEELKALNSELAKTRSKRNKLGGDDTKIVVKDVAEIQVKVLTEAEIHLQISYVVRGPSWTPVYDLRINTDARSVDVTYNATVKQSTEEDWSDVTLELSTAKAQYGATPPKAQGWILQWYSPPVVQDFRKSARRSGSSRIHHRAERIEPQAANMMLTNMMPMQQMMPVMDQDEEEDGLMASAPGGAAPIASAAATVTQSSTSASFSIAGLNTIKCDGEPFKCTIVQETFKGYFRYSATPKLSGHTYLKVRCTNKTPFTMLQGQAHIFADNQYVAASELDLVAPGEDFWTFVGIDDSVPVKRELVHKKVHTEKGWMSKTQGTNFKYLFTVENKKKTDEEIVIWDQLPIIGNKKIEMKLVVPTIERHKEGKDPFFKIDPAQNIEWICNLKPLEKRTFEFDFIVEAPADDMIIGLEQ